MDDTATPTPPPQAIAIDMDAIVQDVDAEIALVRHIIEVKQAELRQFVEAKQAELHQAELRLALAQGQRALIERMLQAARR